MRYRKELETALEAVRQASVLCRSVQAQLETKTLKKDDRSPVTVADFGSQALICRVLGEEFPDDAVIAEEDSAALRQPDNRHVLEQVVAEVRNVMPEGDGCQVTDWIDRGNASKYSDRFWTLDPIDGTKGFLRGDQYAVALALIVDGELAVAALACPKLGEEGSIYSAVRGEGAHRSGVDETGDQQRISVSYVGDPAEARFCESVESAHSSHGQAAALAETLGIRRDSYRIDSQAKYAVVANGDAEIYLRLTSHTGYVEKIWDHAAGALVIEEAGGTVTDLNGKKLDFSRGHRLENNIGIVASNGRFHDRILAALEKVQSHPTEKKT